MKEVEFFYMIGLPRDVHCLEAKEKFEQWMKSQGWQYKGAVNELKPQEKAAPFFDKFEKYNG